MAGVSSAELLFPFVLIAFFANARPRAYKARTGDRVGVLLARAFDEGASKVNVLKFDARMRCLADMMVKNPAEDAS